MFGKAKSLEKEIVKLKEELKDSDESNYKSSKTIVDLTEYLRKEKEKCEYLQDKVDALERELSIFRNEREEIDKKTKCGIDKDAVIIQLILEKDRLAIENQKQYIQMIEKDRATIEAARLALHRPIPLMCNFPAGGIAQF